MTKLDAIDRLISAAEDDPDLEAEATELFRALYGHPPDELSAFEIISHCYAALEADPCAKGGK